MGRRGQYAPALQRHIFTRREGGRCFSLHRILADFYDIVVCADANERVNLRDFIEHLLLITLRETACHHKALDRAILFQLRHLKDAVDCLALCILNKAAGVHDHEIRIIGIVREQEACILKLCEHDFRIHLVFGAAEGYHSDFIGHFTVSPFGKNKSFSISYAPYHSRNSKN